eukprot:gene36957-45590_t
MDAGLSIGFCNPAEKDDWSKLFTIGYVLVGSSVVSGCLGLFASTIIFTKVSVVAKDVSLENMTMKDAELDRITIRSFSLYHWHRFKLAIGWYTNRSRIITLVMFTIWMGLGTAYGMVFEHWSFITSLYWAITTASTGGLQSAPCAADTDDMYKHCDMGNVRGSLMGVFMMIGVPLYACTLGQFAKIAITRAIEAREARLLKRPIEDAEFIFAANILSPEGSETLVCGEYILLELMRLGQTNQRQIEKIKSNFYKLDKYSVGELDINDLRRTGKVVSKRIRPGQIVRKIRTRSMEIFGSPFRKSGSQASFSEASGVTAATGLQSTESVAKPRENKDRLEKALFTESAGSEITPAVVAKSVKPSGKKSFRKSIRTMSPSSLEIRTDLEWVGGGGEGKDSDDGSFHGGNDGGVFDDFYFDQDDDFSGEHPHEVNVHRASDAPRLKQRNEEHHEQSDQRYHLTSEGDDDDSGEESDGLEGMALAGAIHDQQGSSDSYRQLEEGEGGGRSLDGGKSLEMRQAFESSFRDV